MSVDELRKMIDDIDAKIASLIAYRVRIAGEVGKEKRKEGKQIVDANREQEVLEAVKSVAREKGMSQADMQAIYQQIITASRSRQGITVAFQGEAGAYSEEAAFSFFGTSAQTVPCEKFEDVFRIVEKGEVEFGIIPIENSLEGSISQCYDLLLDSPLKVCGEIGLRIVHCLIANPGATLDSLKKIYSHPQALGQSRAFLKHLNAELVPTYDTAGSVKMIKEMGTKDVAAVASSRAAEIYDMRIIAREIEDNPHNFTRFFILSLKDAPPTGKDKTSIVFSVKHKPGSLYEFLKELANRNINLTKIESRPTRQKPWEYNFYMDFEGHREDDAAKNALAKLDELSIFMKVLGSYPKAVNNK